jgi:DnaJ-domain-containing protein 1
MVRKRRFSAQPSTIQRDLRRVIEQMGATSLHVSQDIFQGTAEIIFDRGGRRYVFRCDKYGDPLDNLRAAQLTITYLWRALEEYGVTSEEQALERSFAQFFLGFEAVPDDTVLLLGSGRDEWWEILGVDPNADRQAVVNAYRALAKIHHPDTGGDPGDFKRLREAYDQALQALERYA